MSRLKNAIKKHGLSGTIAKLPGFIKSRIRRLYLYPTALTRFGITKSRWEKFQIEHELDFWNNIESSRFYEQSHENLLTTSFESHNKKFTNLKLEFADGVAADIGCGPQGGMLSFVKAKFKLGVDPLADEYSKKFSRDQSIVMINAMGEEIPLLTSSVDACYCINALDHSMKPFKVLAEIYRILKPGGYLAFSVDIGGTKGHPIKLYEKDLDIFFTDKSFRITEKKCSTDNSVWGKDAKIPLYVFQGFKTNNL